MSALLEDVRYAARSLPKSMGFTIAAILTLALGIGANTAIFSVVNTVLLRGLPYHQPDRLMMLWEHHLTTGKTLHNVVSPENFLVWQDESRSFDAMAAWIDMQGAVSGGDQEPVSVQVRYASAPVFSILGVKPMFGRSYTRATDPIVYFGSVVLLTAVALLATYLPVRRATRIEPSIALKNE